jgi:hypothetical protein
VADVNIFSWLPSNIRLGRETGAAPVANKPALAIAESAKCKDTSSTSLNTWSGAYSCQPVSGTPEKISS